MESHLGFPEIPPYSSCLQNMGLNVYVLHGMRPICQYGNFSVNKSEDNPKCSLLPTVFNFMSHLLLILFCKNTISCFLKKSSVLL